MESQRRWFCRECKREWLDPQACFANSSPVSITGNPKSLMNCIVCGSPEIELREFKPDYPGLDVPRDEPHRYRVIPMRSESQIRGFDLRVEDRPLKNRDPEELIKSELINKIVEGERSSVYDLSDMD